MTPAKVTLDQQLQALVLSIAAEQRVLDDSWHEEVRQFLPVWQLARAGGLAALAQAIAPRRLVTTDATVDARMFVSHERAAGVSVRLATLGLHRRYERTATANLLIRCTLTARPDSPGPRVGN